MIYNPENIRLREVDSHSGRRFKVSYYFRSLDVRNGGNPVRPLGELEVELFPMRAGRVSAQAARSPCWCGISTRVISRSRPLIALLPAMLR